MGREDRGFGERSGQDDRAENRQASSKFFTAPVLLLSLVKKLYGIAFRIALFLAAFHLVSGQTKVSDCGTCHRSITAEWFNSLHSKASSTRQFLALKEKRVDPSCGCHAPVPLAPDKLGKTPPTREGNHAAGIDCQSCHLDSEMVVWSSGVRRFVPHWTRQAEVYSTGEFCAGCHSWAEDTGYDCSSCHMPSVEGPAADGPHLESPAQSTHLSHRWAGSSDSELVSSALSMEVDTGGQEVAVDITNLVYAHKFPATDHRKVILVLVEGDRGRVFWQEPVTIPAASTVSHRIRKPAVRGALTLQLRYYPAPEIGSDEFFTIETHRIAE